MERAVLGCVAEACSQAGLDPATVCFEAACFGMSGGPEDKQSILAEILRTERLVVTTDAVIALAGATETGQGIIAISGTGSIAFGRNAAGRSTRAGGWGYIYGDEGSAFDVGRQALRAGLRMEEGWGPATRLHELLLGATGSTTANEVLHRFYTPDWPRQRVAKLAPMVDTAAIEGDPVAIGILHAAAQELATFVGAIRSQLWTPGDPVEVAYIGGTFQSRSLLERFRTLVELEPGLGAVRLREVQPRGRCWKRTGRLLAVSGGALLRYASDGRQALPRRDGVRYATVRTCRQSVC